MHIPKTFARIVAAAALALAAGSAFAEEPMKLKIGTEGAYPPFNSIAADGSVIGFDIDIANALCAQMKAQCEIVTQDWDGMIPALQAGKFDAIVASMSITEERKKQISFTNKYYVTPLSVVALKDSDLSTTDAAAYSGKTVGAQASTTQATYADEVYGKAGAEAKLYPSQDEAMADLVNGRLDAVVADKFVLVDWMDKTGKDCCKMVGDIEGTEAPAGIGVRQADDELREKLNAAIEAIVADGTYGKIVGKYFKFDIYGG